ncbi:GLPGLI family protein [Chryseobacterium hispalense]|uniref:GLPGLI family protein n=1 Tax=Chryseobacterium hispalense TaxID=1453492 RepID=UPI00391BF711
MKNLILSTILFVYVSVQSQNRFKYVLHFKIDSTNRAFVQNEIFNLDYMDGQSIFYSEALAKLDSVRTAGSSLYKDNVPEPKLDYIVSYDAKTDRLWFKETIGFSMFLVEEPRKIKWNISSVTDKISGYSAQKAYAEFGGRSWTAWFTTDLKISEGPYKFKGLPGLVLKVSDRNEDYVFELTAIQKLEKLYDFKSFEKLGIKTVRVDFAKYLELKDNFAKNPETVLFQIPGQSQLNIPASEIRVLGEVLKERAKKSNNQMELSSRE